MTVYIEYLLIDNLAIDGVISALTLRALRLSVKKRRIIAAAAFGTATAFLLPLLSLNSAVLFIIRILTGACMAFLIHNHKSFRQYLICFVIFMAITFVLGGACFGVLFLSGAKITGDTVLDYQSGIPAGLIVLTAAATAFSVRRLCLYLNKSKDIAGFIRRAGLYANGESTEFDAFIDSGNQLYDADSGLPVIIVESIILLRLFKNTTASLLDKGEAAKPKITLRNGHYIEYSTLNGKSTKLLVFRPDKLVIYSGGQANIIYDVMVGVHNGKLNGDAKYSALLHPALIKS